ncbi:outer membrane beta-barrel family protein [Pedobacter nyackensis]|uniref:outer membrane beta-barrel family protein n=1 Tax=Pedobacter nyackensis TaxID=475255 RepID=UPI00292EB05D|nr:outer membrane beta-barrel family protein [Pedobacter nyackensis]
MKTKLFNCLLLIFCSFSLLFSKQASAQTIGEISGKVLDEELKAFPYASVSLLDAKDSTSVKGTLTSDNGLYAFKGLNIGKYLVAVYVLGYKKTVKGPYSITSDSKPVLVDQIQLHNDVKLLKGVEIVKQKPLIERQIDKTVLNIENSILATGNTALEILEKAPGVTVDKEGKISLRGKQGVNVMLDGKPANLSAEQLANVLRSTEGTAIQSIELITNPSAKYDAAGNSGIINIKLKKNRNYGLNGSITAGAGYGTHHKINSGLNVNYRNKKFNFYGNGDYGFNKRFSETDISRVNGTTTNQTYFDQTSHNISKRTNRNYKAGLDYFINDNQTLGFFVNGYHGNGPNHADVLTLIGDKPGTVDSSVVAPNTSSSKYYGITYNLNYRGVIDTLGQEISIDMDYSRHNDVQENIFNNSYKNASGLPLKPDYIFRNSSPSIVKIYGAKVDYVLPLAKETKLEFGGKTSIVETDNNFIFENFYNEKWENDLSRSNQFIYNENINAAYANLKRKFKTTSIQLGLRAEQTNSKGNSITEQKVVKRSYINLFPSLFINQELSKDHEIGFSYSRRIDRPDYGSLNPFIYYLDLYSYRFGNPFLKPQYTNSIEFSYSFKKNLNVTIGYSQTNDVMTEVLLTDTAKKTIFISVQNLAKQNSYNMNTSYPIAITKWWKSNNNLTVYYNRFETPDLLGAPYASGRLAFNLNTNQTITLNSSTKIEWSGNYESKQVYGTLLIAPRYGIDMGASKSFMDNKLNIKFAANDVFKLQKSKITSTLPSQNYVVNERWESRVFRLTCTYRFGSNEIKAARQRSSGSENESKRVKSGN